MKKVYATWSLLFLLFLAACKKDPVEPTSSGDGTLKGIVYSPNGKVPLAAAKVETVVNGTTKSVVTDKDGRFSLDLPAGDYNISMYTGAGNQLALQRSFSVAAGKTISIPASQTSLAFTSKIAFIEGEFDAIQTLVNEMGIPIDALSADDLLDYNTLKKYDILLLNCGSAFEDFENTRVLERFLKEGGSIYASDWEMSNLSEQEWGFIPQPLLSYTTDGAAEITEGNVLFEPFKTALGKASITIDFDLAGYVQIANYARNDPRFQVLVDHPQKGPLAMKIQWGPSKTSPRGTSYGGAIIYTTFHDASLTSDVKTVLRQMVLAL